MTDRGWGFETAVRTLWQEARGEPPVGREAVAHVIVNRLKSGRWGHTYGQVCLAPFQFSGWNSHDPNRMLAAALPDEDLLLTELRAILAGAEQGTDFTLGALYYFAPLGVSKTPSWVSGAIFCGAWGHQRFYKGIK